MGAAAIVKLACMQNVVLVTAQLIMSNFGNCEVTALRNFRRDRKLKDPNCKGKRKATDEGTSGMQPSKRTRTEAVS